MFLTVDPKMPNESQTPSKFLLGLSGDLWPLHIKPKPGELFSSWLIRFGHIHGYKAETICTLLFGYRSSIWNRDIDKLCPASVLSKMLAVTGSEYSNGYATFLSSYEGILTLGFNKDGNTKWIIPLGIHHRNRTRPGLMYCPRCLEEDPTPYYRKLWRIAWATVCTKHHVRFLDVCPNCGEYVMPHRADHLAKNSIPMEFTLVKCCSCGQPLFNAPSLVADDGVVRLQTVFESALRDGYVAWGDNNNLYSFLLFEGVRTLTLHIMRTEFSKENHTSLKREIEFIDLGKRYEVMKHASCLLEHWPYCFQGYVEGADSSFCYLKNYDFDDVPFWYDSEIRKTTKMYAKLSAEEVAAIRNYVRRSGGHDDAVGARKLTGRDISKYLRNNK